MIIDEISYKGIKAKIRPNTSDAFILEEIFSRGVYHKLDIKNEDRILDIGLNIGIFTIWALKKGAKEVYGFEPEPQNYNLAVDNVKLNGLYSRAVMINKAVTGTNDPFRNFAINLKKNKGAHSLVPRRGRRKMVVRCININEAIAMAKPDIIKMDIEGGEYECLKGIKSFNGIREIILEFHHDHLKDKVHHNKYNEILYLLRKQFAFVDARPADVIGGAWTSLIYCSNKVED